MSRQLGILVSSSDERLELEITVCVLCVALVVDTVGFNGSWGYLGKRKGSPEDGAWSTSNIGWPGGEESPYTGD